MVSMVMMIFKPLFLSVGIRTCGCARMLRWRRCLFVFSRLLDGVGLVGCRIEQAPAFAGRRRPFATEYRFAVLELGRRIRIRWGARRLGTVHLLLVVQFLLVLGFQCLNCGGVLRFQ